MLCASLYGCWARRVCEGVAGLHVEQAQHHPVAIQAAPEGSLAAARTLPLTYCRYAASARLVSEPQPSSQLCELRTQDTRMSSPRSGVPSLLDLRERRETSRAQLSLPAVDVQQILEQRFGIACLRPVPQVRQKLPDEGIYLGHQSVD